MFNNNQGQFVEPTPAVFRLDLLSQRRDAAITAYRHNIALPDVHIADHLEPYEPKVVGDDGQPLTPEQRAARMKGLPTCVDEEGRVRGVDPEAEDHDYREDFADIEQEVWGTAAVANRPGIRVVKPRELELPVTEETLESAKVLQDGQ